MGRENRAPGQAVVVKASPGRKGDPMVYELNWTSFSRLGCWLLNLRPLDLSFSDASGTCRYV